MFRKTNFFESLEDRYLLSSLPVIAIEGSTLKLPGDDTQLVTIQATWTTKQAEYNNEFGVVLVEDALGTVEGIQPSEPDYRVSTLASAAKEEVFASGEGVGAVSTLTFPGGTLLAPYLVANASSDEYLAAIANDEQLRERDAFFSFAGTNSDGFDHFRFSENAEGLLTVAGEDIRGGGDQDFSDVVVTLEVVAITNSPPLSGGDITIVSAPEGVTLDGDDKSLDLSGLGPGRHTIVVDVAGEISEPPAAPGGEVVINETFADGQFSADWTGVYSTDNRGQIVELPDGDYAYEFEYRADEQSFKLEQYPIEFDSVYVRIEEAFPDGLPTSGAMKQSRIFDPSGGEYLNLQIWGNGRQDTNFSPMDTAVYYDFPVNVGETIVTEYFFAWSDPGQASGKYWLKRDGEALVAFDNLELTPGEAGIWIGGNISQAGENPTPFRRQLRSVQIIANPTGSITELPAGEFDYSVVGNYPL